MVIKMKECEIYSNLKVPCGSKIVIRADGRNFSKLSNDLKLERPYDTNFANLMVGICNDFFLEFSPEFIFTFSDEINILLSDIPFSGRVEKLDSVFASFISGSFTKNLIKNFKDYALYEILKPISFDSRIIPLSDSGVYEYFKTRQNEAWRNCLNGYSYWKLRKEFSKSHTMEILNKKNSSALHEILFKRGITISELPLWQRRGIGIYKKEVSVNGYNPMKNEKVISKRLKIHIDWNLPLFNREFFNKNSLDI